MGLAGDLGVSVWPWQGVPKQGVYPRPSIRVIWSREEAWGSEHNFILCREQMVLGTGGLHTGGSGACPELTHEGQSLLQGCCLSWGVLSWGSRRELVLSRGCALSVDARVRQRGWT